MNTKIIIGAQWGDEGKGKFVDVFSEKADYCVRFQGGDNAGHTIVDGDKVYKLRLIPSGILRGATCIIGAGCVVNLKNLATEIETLTQANITVNPTNLTIDKKATIVLPIYPLVDAELEKEKGSIGTTKNGIGIAYEDRASRIALRAEDFTTEKNIETVSNRVQKIAKKYASILNRNYDALELEIYNFIKQYEFIFAPFIKDGGEILHKAFQEQKNIVIEGAQGAMLDNVNGDYPYVTSSCTLAGGIEQSIGCALPKNTEKIGIIKAYATRVGNGPFPTEMFDETGEKIAQIGCEIGTVTGRKRRCGWLDLDLLTYVNRLNGFDCLGITKADVLDDFEEVKLKHNNELISFKGWRNIKNTTALDDFDSNFITYLKYIEKATQLPIKYISTGADRENIIVIE
jgi:adenylosuccinate synthase